MEKQVSFFFTDCQKDRYLVCDNVSKRGYVVSRGNPKSGKAKRMEVDVFISKANKRQQISDDDGGGKEEETPSRRRGLCTRLFRRRRSDEPDTNINIIPKYDSVANLNHIDSSATTTATTNDSSNDDNGRKVRSPRKKWQTRLRTFFGITVIDDDEVYGFKSNQQRIIVSSKIDESKCIFQMETTV